MWRYDLARCRATAGRAVRRLTVIDEHTRECPAIDVARRITADDVLHRLCDLSAGRGVPGHIRSGNGPEFTAKAVRRRWGRVGARTPHIEPGSPWETGYVESFNGQVRDELLNPERFGTLRAARVLTERWRRAYHPGRPHSARGGRRPAPEARLVGPPGASGPAASGGDP